MFSNNFHQTTVQQEQQKQQLEAPLDLRVSLQVKGKFHTDKKIFLSFYQNFILRALLSRS